MIVSSKFKSVCKNQSETYLTVIIKRISLEGHTGAIGIRPWLITEQAISFRVALVCASPRESEWDADVSHGSRESQLSSTTVNKIDWGGGPSYGVDGSCRGGARDYSLLSPAMPRKGSVVTFDVGEPGVRRHSSPAQQPIRRKNAVVSTMASISDCQPLSSALKYCKDASPPPTQQQQQLRYVDDYKTLTQLRKRSAGDQSIISIAIHEDDSGEQKEGREEEEEDEEEGEQADDDDDDEDDDLPTTATRLKMSRQTQEKNRHRQRRHHEHHQQTPQKLSFSCDGVLPLCPNWILFRLRLRLELALWLETELVLWIERNGSTPS